MMMHELSKIAVVTGAGSGIGRAIAGRLARDGAIVMVADINKPKAEETTRAIVKSGRQAVSLELDVGEPKMVQAVYDSIAAKYGRLDIQVSNAGVTARTPFLDVSLETFHGIIRTNLYGALLCGQAAARLMRATGGRIVNITSISGQQGGTGRAAYGASKAAIINLTQTMAVELAPFGILVNAVAPGPTQVERTAHGPNQKAAMLARLAIKRYAQPDEIAAAVAFLVSEENTFATGHVLNVDGGFLAAGVMYDPSNEAI
jgi:3-oxoacyl-[acyl-carrier protein] reductase